MSSGVLGEEPAEAPSGFRRRPPRKKGSDLGRPSPRAIRTTSSCCSCNWASGIRWGSLRQCRCGSWQHPILTQRRSSGRGGEELAASDFRWKDYCPMVFRHLRRLFTVDPAQ